MVKTKWTGSTYTEQILGITPFVFEGTIQKETITNKYMIFAQAIVFQPYFMKTTISISIWLQLSNNKSSKLLKNFSKSISLAILSYHHGFFKTNEILNFSSTFLGALWSLKRWKTYLKQKLRYRSSWKKNVKFNFCRFLGYFMILSTISL